MASAACPELPSLLESADKIAATEIGAAQALQQLLKDPQSPFSLALLQTIERIERCTGRIIVTGMGKSGHIARKIQATLASTGTPSFFLHPGEAAHGDLGMMQSEDFLLAFSTSGETSELVPLFLQARNAGMQNALFTTDPHSRLARMARLVLPLPSAPEACPFGLAPTSSTFVQLLAGDILSVILLERRGFDADQFIKNHPAGNLGARLQKVSSLMHAGNALPLGPLEMPLKAIILEMTRKMFGCMGVTDRHGQLAGLIADGDLRRALRKDIPNCRAQDIMNPAPVTVTENMTAQDVLRLMNQRSTPLSSIFVVDKTGHPVGILHLHDLIRVHL